MFVALLQLLFLQASDNEGNSTSSENVNVAVTPQHSKDDMQTAMVIQVELSVVPYAEQRTDFSFCCR